MTHFSAALRQGTPLVSVMMLAWMGLVVVPASASQSSLIERSAGLHCEGQIKFDPEEGEIQGVTLSFDEPDHHGANGKIRFAQSEGGAFYACRATRLDGELECTAEAGPVESPMLLRFSSDLAQLRGGLGSYFDDAQIRFEAACMREAS